MFFDVTIVFSERIASACYWYFCDIVFFFSAPWQAVVSALFWPKCREHSCQHCTGYLSLKPCASGCSLRGHLWGGNNNHKKTGPTTNLSQTNSYLSIFILDLKINIFVLIMHSRDPLVSLAGVFFGTLLKINSGLETWGSPWFTLPPQIFRSTANFFGTWKC